MMRPRDHMAGVTLLETMIALVVMAFLSIILAASLSMGARVMSRSGDVTDELDQAIARLMLRTSLEHSVASPFPDKTGGGLVGNVSEMVFYSFLDDDVFWAGAAVMFTLDGAPGSGPDNGIVVQATGLSAVDRREIQRDLVIVSAANEMLISYWGRAKPTELPRWHDTWSEDAGLPDLVKLTFFGTERAIPPMVVRPGKAFSQSEMSLSSLLPPALPSRP